MMRAGQTSIGFLLPRFHPARFSARLRMIEVYVALPVSTRRATACPASWYATHFGGGVFFFAVLRDPVTLEASIGLVPSCCKTPLGPMPRRRGARGEGPPRSSRAGNTPTLTRGLSKLGLAGSHWSSPCSSSGVLTRTKHGPSPPQAKRIGPPPLLVTSCAPRNRSACVITVGSRPQNLSAPPPHTPEHNHYRAGRPVVLQDLGPGSVVLVRQGVEDVPMPRPRRPGP